MGPPRPGPLRNRPFGDKCSQQGEPSQANRGPKNLSRSRGIGTIPTLDDVERFRTANQQRVQGFLKEQNIREVGLFS
jgi:hypothetical protein